MRVRALIAATFLGVALLPALALVALADEDPPLRPVDAGPPLRPPITVLRAAVTAPPAPLPSVALGSVAGARRELIVLVGGLGSASDDDTFKAFRERLAKEGGYDVVRFGQDLGTYDTLGEVDANAERLRDSIRSASIGYDGVHIVTHSMGGVVADRAFALGLSASDGVTTYVAWSAPHDGSHAARVARAALTLSGPARTDAREVAVSADLHDPESVAVRDLARIRAIGPPTGVIRLDLRLAMDAVVSSADARDPGVDSRVLLPTSLGELEGHGGILKSEQALDLTMATIKSRALPPDERGYALRAASDVVAQIVDGHAQPFLAGLCGVVLLGGISALFRRTLRRALPWPPLTE